MQQGRVRTRSLNVAIPLWKAALAGLAVAAASAQALAQTSQQQPYSGVQAREVKALSAKQMADLAAGRGMGLALAAELNGYSGPRHVLELADPLGLSEGQRASTKRLFDSMTVEAIPLGQKLIAAERDLDRQFAERTITPERLQAATATIAEIQAELRHTHLKYHLATAALLSLDQIRRYDELRGYTGAPAANGTHPGPHTVAPAHGMTGGRMHHQ
jgi:hypothetical protein